ncbi:phosphomethylpyrimidine kinase, partial [Achromatium sp. WMS1]
LAATIATKLAMGIPLTTAIAQAQIYTWKSLKQAFTSGHCQLTPNRFYAQRF